MCSSPGRRTLNRTPLHSAPSQSYAEYSAMVARSNISYTQRQQEKKQQMIDSKYPHVRVVKINRLVCPLHILTLKKNLDKIAPSETLKVIPGNHALEKDLIAACHSLGHKTLLVDNEGHQELYVTRLH